MISPTCCVVFALAILGPLQGAEQTGPSGTPAVSAATDQRPACCAEGSQEATSAPLSARSVYQVDTTWTDDAGRKIKLAELRGHPVVLAMFYTRCQYACPMIVATMQRIQAELPLPAQARARFVLISFDSEHDTPSVLHAYRQEMGLPKGTWTLAWGESENVRELAMVLGIKYQQVGDGQFAHSTMITILDARGEIAYQQPDLQTGSGTAVRAIVLATK